MIPPRTQRASPDPRPQTPDPMFTAQAQPDTIATPVQAADALEQSQRTSLAALRREAIDTLRLAGFSAPRTPRLFGASTKTEASRGVKVDTIVAYMLPGKLCPNASRQCLAACLGTRSGMLALSPARRAQRWKSALLQLDPVLFLAIACAEISAHLRACKRSGYVPAVRLDGSSDTGIGALLAPYFPDAHFYDYTKSEARMMSDRPANYDLTFSRSEDNGDAVGRVLAAGQKVAAVFAVRPKSERLGRPCALPVGRTWMGAPIISGDAHDARFRDPKPEPGVGLIVALSLKGSDAPFAKIRERAGEFALDVSACDPVYLWG